MNYFDIFKLEGKMNNKVKSKKELLNELQELQEKYESLKTSKIKIEAESVLANKDFSFENKEKHINKPTLSTHSQKKIEGSEKRYRALFESMPSGFVLFEVVQNDKGSPIDLLIIDANERFATTTGLKLNDAVGKHLTQVLPGIEKDAADWIGTYSKVALTGKSNQFEQGSELLGYYYLVTAYKSGPNRCAVIFDDITERKKTESLLQNEKERTNAILNLVGYPIFLKDNDHRIISANHSFFELFGMDEKSVIGKTLAENISENEMQHFLKIDRDVLDTGIPDIREEELTVKGITSTTITEKKRHIDAFGNKFLVGTIYDITEQKEREKALKESENKFSILFGQSSIPAALTQFPGHEFVDVNDAFVELFGFTKEELIGKTSIQIGLNRNVKSRTQNIKKIKEQSQLRNLEQNFFSKSGQQITVLTNVNVVEIDGKNHAIISLQDIRERKLAEKIIREKDSEFRKLSANMPDLIFQFTRKPDGSYFVPIASAGIINIFGCTPEDVKDDFGPIGRVIHPDDAVRVINDIEYSAKNLTYFSCEFRVQIPGKPVQWIYSKSTPEKLSDGSITWYGFNTDITDRKQAEETIKESEQLLRLSSELAKVAAWEMDLVNDNMTRSSNHDSLYGLTDVDQWHVNTFMDATHIDDRDKCNAIINESLEPDGPNQYKFDFRILYPDKSIHWLNVIGEIIERDSNGVGIKIRGFINDITNRKEAEIALKESEERFYKIFDEGPLGIAMADFNNGYFINANQAFCKMLGYTKEEMTRLTFKDVTFTDYQNTDLEAIKDILDGSIQIHRTEKQYLKKNGETLWAMRSLSKIVSSDGKSTYGLAMIEDITERKLAELALIDSENHFRQLFEDNPQPMWIYELENLKFKDVNNTALKKYGYSKEEFLSMTLKDIRPSENVPSLLINIEESSNEYEASGLWRHQLKDGTIIFVEIFSHNLKRYDKSSRLVLVNDITERVQAEKELKKHKDHLEELVNERTKEIEKKNTTLEKMNNLFVGRELRMKELKEEIEKLKLKIK